MRTSRVEQVCALTANGLSALVVLAVVACDDGSPRLRSPTAPDSHGSPSSPLQTAEANYVGDAVVISVSGSGGCGWGTSPGESRAGVYWRVTIDGVLIELDEDMENWPTDHIGFIGTLEGHSFVAGYNGGGDDLRWDCQFQGASLTGTFSQDMQSFEAFETLFWGPPENELRVERSWHVERLTG